MTGFNFEELFAEDAEPIPHYIMKGMSNKINLNLWDGFHKSVLGIGKEIIANPELMGKYKGLKKNMMAPLLPLFFNTVTGKVNVDVKPEDVESLMGYPQAAMA